MTDKKHFCILPWVHFHFNQEGNARVCCVSEIPHKLGSVHTETMTEIWNGEKMKTIRQKMLFDEPVSACTTCYQMEAIGKRSSRMVFNDVFRKQIPNAIKQGVTAKEEFKYWDLRFSNICNFKCRMCGPLSSSQWIQDIQKIDPNQAKKYTQIDVTKNSKHDIWQQLDPHFRHVERIYFAGGEPLLMKEHYQILERIIDDGRADKVTLAYSTNFSELQFKGKHVFDLWKHFPDVTLMMSVDAPSPVCEYVRHGFDWKVFTKNVERLRIVVPHVKVQVNPVLNVLTVFTITDLHQQLVEEGIIPVDNFYITMLIFPLYLRVDYMPQELKDIVHKKIQQYAGILRQQKASQEVIEKFGQIVTFMNGDKHRPDQMEKLKEAMTTLDNIRGENLLNVVPELNKLWSYK